MSRQSDVINSPAVIVRRKAGVVHVKLNRPKHYNALSSDVLQQLLLTLECRHDDDRVLLLEGGNNAFSIGSDIRELAQMNASEAEHYSLLAHRVVTMLEAWPGMTVAVLQSYVIGAALELVLGCDLIAAQPGLKIGMPGLAWALLPVMGGLRRLRARCNADLARRVFLGGEILDVEQAIEQRLIHRLLQDEDDLPALLEEALEWSPAAVLAIRELRLRDFSQINVRSEAGVFAAGFRNGECQRRLSDLLDS